MEDYSSRRKNRNLGFGNHYGFGRPRNKLWFNTNPLNCGNEDEPDEKKQEVIESEEPQTQLRLFGHTADPAELVRLDKERQERISPWVAEMYNVSADD